MPYYPPASSGSFLPLSGGTMTGDLVMTNGIAMGWSDAKFERAAANYVQLVNGSGTKGTLEVGTIHTVGVSVSYLSRRISVVASDAHGLVIGTSLDSPDVGLMRNAEGVFEVNNGTSGTFRDIKVRSIIIDGAPSTSGAGQIAIGADTRTTIGANGGASALTALPVGYIDIDIAGSAYQIPYYNRGA